MPTAQYGVSLSIAGVSISQSVSRQADGAAGVEITLPVAWPLTSWVKTDANTAAGNLASGHGQTNGTYDVYWSGGSRYGVPVTISTNAVSLDGGSGDDFPASATTTVVMVKQTAFNVAIDGDRLSILGLCLQAADPNSVAVGRVLFEDAAGDDITDLELVANVPLVYDVAGGVTNPFTGDPIVSGVASQSSTSATATLKIPFLFDSTP